MDDQGFDFQRSAPRREPKAFEPPPWEAEAFDELRAAQTTRGESESAAAEAGEQAVLEVEPEDDSALVAEVAEEPAAMSGEEPKGQTEPVSPEEDGQVAAMLAQLSAEEGGTTQATARVAYVGGSVVGAVGVAFCIWGAVLAVMAAPTNVTATMGGALMVFLGVAVLAIAAWMIVRTLRQRGVL